MHFHRRVHACLPKARRSGRRHTAGQGDQCPGLVDSRPDAVGEEIIMTTKEYHRPMSAVWWLHNTQLKLFMIRTDQRVVAGLRRLSHHLDFQHQQPTAFADTLRSPGALVFQIIALPFVLFPA